MRVSVVWSSGGEGGVEEWISGAALLPPSLRSERLGSSAGVCALLSHARGKGCGGVWRAAVPLRASYEGRSAVALAAFNMPWCEVEAHEEDTLQRQHHARSHARVS